jgi:hypothetical protein
MTDSLGSTKNIVSAMYRSGAESCSGVAVQSRERGAADVGLECGTCGAKATIQSDVEGTLNAWPRFRTSRESKEEPTFLTAGLQGASRYCEGSNFRMCNGDKVPDHVRTVSKGWVF